MLLILKFLQPLKASSSTLVFGSMITEDNLVQLAKANFSIDFTDFGMDTEVNPVQLEKTQ